MRASDRCHYQHQKDLEWRSLPSDRDNGLVPVPESLVNAQPIEPFLQELKERTFAKYNAFTVGEVFNETDEELHFFIGKDGVFSSIFDFKQTMLGQEGKGWFDHSLPTADELKESIFQAHERADSIGVLSTIIENHDEPRGVSHYIAEGQVNDTSKKLWELFKSCVREFLFYLPRPRNWNGEPSL